MKKQFQILAATFITVAFISCSKETIENQHVGYNEEITTQSNRPGQPIVIDPLSVKLEGWFPFNGTLKDKTNKLPDAVPTTRGYIFGGDRKGNLKSAMYFDSTYALKISNVPQQTNTSLSVWVKFVYQSQFSRRFVGPNTGPGPAVVQKDDRYLGVVEIDTYGAFGNSSGWVTNDYWHHLAVTYDGTAIKFYTDGVLKSTYNKTGSISPTEVQYILGRDLLGRNWRGYIDELRFYSRTLSASDVQKLYNL
jgi:hypothetical protein